MNCGKNHPSRVFIPCKTCQKKIVEFYIEKKLFSHQKKLVFVQKKGVAFRKKSLKVIPKKKKDLYCAK